MLDRARDATAELTLAVESGSGVPVATLARDTAIRRALGALRAAAKNFSSKVSTVAITEPTSRAFVEALLGSDDELQAIRFLVGRVEQVLGRSDGSVHRGALFRVVDRTESLDGLEEGAASIEPDQAGRASRVANLSSPLRTGRTFRIANLHSLAMSDSGGPHSAAETLLDVFVPPEGMVGHSAALVAMTGADDFLEATVQRFSGLRPRQRAELGNVLVYLMLDSHASAARPSVRPPGRVPGLHELQPRGVDPRSLLHAKLALLAFAPNRTADPVHLRLVVLTGNFTYASARQQLELAWTIDIACDGTARAAERAEVAEAGTFVELLIERRFYRDGQGLPSKQHGLTARLDTLLKTARDLAPANAKPRFMHSLDRPLYEQIRQRFRSKIHSPRNLLLCGSGFYEEPSEKERKPSVLTKLEHIAKFTAKVRRVALVEPGEAGAVAPWAAQGTTEGWEIARPSDALGINRCLHAKFVYAGYLRDDHASNGWLYLGSGNLSHRGLLTSGAMAAGNVECGVIIPVNERLNEEDIESKLFWSPDAKDIGADEWKVGQVGDAPETMTLIEAPPILSALIELSSEPALRLLWREDTPQDARTSICWTGRDWKVVARGERSVLLLDTERPSALCVRDDGSGRGWTVPVVDPAGRVCWQPPRFATYADVLDALLDFPIRPAEAADDDEDADGDGTGASAAGSGGGIENEKSYALHHAAELIEKVAALQVALPESMLDDWLDHLDRMFRASFPEVLVSTWREHRIDVFAHLRDPELALRNSQRSSALATSRFSTAPPSCGGCDDVLMGGCGKCAKKVRRAGCGETVTQPAARRRPARIVDVDGETHPAKRRGAGRRGRHGKNANRLCGGARGDRGRWARGRRCAARPDASVDR